MSGFYWCSQTWEFFFYDNYFDTLLNSMSKYVLLRRRVIVNMLDRCLSSTVLLQPKRQVQNTTWTATCRSERNDTKGLVYLWNKQLVFPCLYGRWLWMLFTLLWGQFHLLCDLLEEIAPLQCGCMTWRHQFISVSSFASCMTWKHQFISVLFVQSLHWLL